MDPTRVCKELIKSEKCEFISKLRTSNSKGRLLRLPGSEEDGKLAA